MARVQSSCPHCGMAVSAGAKFCGTCGKTLELVGQGVPQPKTGQAVQTPSQATCPHCGAAVSANAMFCRTCGKTMSSERACPHCGAALSPTAQFCRGCGKPVGPSAAQGPDVAPRAMPPIRQPAPAGHASTAPPPALKKKRGRFVSPLACGCLAVLLLCVVIGIGGFVAYQRGDLTIEQVLTLIGQGPPMVRTYNFSDNTINVTLTGPATAEGNTPNPTTEVIKPLMYYSFSPSTTGRYRFDFRTTGNQGTLGTCTLTLNKGDQYRFVVDLDRIMVLPGNKSTIPRAEAIVATSSLCR